MGHYRRLSLASDVRFPRIIVGVARLIANHRHLAIFESTPEVRALCSAGITRLRRSYDPARLPPGPPPVATLRPLPSPMTGLPRLPEPPFRRAVPTTPADRTGARVDCLRTASAAHGGKLTVVAAPYRDHMLLTFGKPETALLARR